MKFMVGDQRFECPSAWTPGGLRVSPRGALPFLLPLAPDRRDATSCRRVKALARADLVSFYSRAAGR